MLAVTRLIVIRSSSPPTNRTRAVRAECDVGIPSPPSPVTLPMIVLAPVLRSIRRRFRVVLLPGPLTPYNVPVRGSIARLLTPMPIGPMTVVAPVAGSMVKRLLELPDAAP